MSTHKIIILNALKIASSIVLYFFAMKLFGLENFSELRFLNFLFIIWGVNTAIKNNIYKNNDTFYFTNLFIGVSTAVIAVAIILISLVIYVSTNNTGFITTLENSYLWGKNLSLPLIVFAIAIEGIASSVIGSFIIMQYWKNHQQKNTTS